MAGRRAVLGLQPQTESCTAVSSKATLSLGGTRTPNFRAGGFMLRCWLLEPPGAHLCLGGQGPAATSVPLACSVQLCACGLTYPSGGDTDFHLRVWSGLSGLSPGLSPALGLPGGWRPALAVWFAHAAVNAPAWNHTRHTHFSPPCRCWGAGRGRHSPGLQSAS